MTSTSGLSADGQVQAIQTIISGGFDLGLVEDTVTIDHGDTAADVDTKAARVETVAEADVTINTPADFSGAADLELTADVTYTAVNTGIVDDFVIIGSTAWALGEEIPGPENPGIDTTGEDVTIPSGETLYELGNP